MANELTLIPTNGNLPDYLKQGGLGYESTGVGEGIAPRAPRLGITTAKQFTITKDGATMILPPGPDGRVAVRGVIVAGAENITKAWYAKSFVPGSKEAPDCFSNDGKTPAPGVKMAQCSNCAACPKNAFGSHPVTGRGKACSDRKMIVFVWEGLPNELMTFNVPTMSLPMLRKIDTDLRDANIPMQAVMMELTFDPNIVYPVVKIGAVGYVQQEKALELIAKSKTQEISDLLRETDFEVEDSQNSHEAAPLVQAGVGGDVGQAGQAGQAGQPSDEQAGAPETPADGASGSADAPKRKRRTKAEMEAARAGGANAQTTGADVLGQPNESPVASQPVETEAERQIRELQEQLAALQNPKPVVPEETPEQRQIRELQEQLTRAQASIAGTTYGANGQQTNVQQGQATAQQALAPENQRVEPAPATAAPMGDITDLLNKWKS